MFLILAPARHSASSSLGRLLHFRIVPDFAASLGFFLNHLALFSFSFLAAILGMYTLMSNKQYYDAICSGTISNTEGINSERLGLGLGEEALSHQVSSPHESHAFPCLGCGRKNQDPPTQFFSPEHSPHSAWGQETVLLG